MRTLLTSFFVVVWCAAFGQSSSEVKSVATIAELMARKGMAGEVVAVSAYSTNVPWSKPRLFTQYSTSVVTNSHDGVHYVTNARPSSVYVSSDKTAEVQLPEWWGAAVDDGVDDSAAIKSALTWGPTVQLSAGVYNVGGNVSGGTAITIPSNRSLRGVPGTKIAIARSEGPHIANGIRIVSATNVVVSGIELYATPAVTNMAAYAYGVLVLSTGVQTKDILIQDCIAHDLTTGFDIAGSGTHPVINTTLSRSIAYRCVNNGAQGVYGDGIKVLDCEFYGNGGTGGAGYGFDLETNAGETTSNVIFARNRSYNNVVGGLAAVAGLGTGGTNIVFVENEVWNNPYGINVNGQESAPYNGITLTGNKFHGNSVRGFVVSRSRQVKIVGNSSDVDDSNAVDDVAHIDISGNTFRNSTNEAIEFQSASMTLYANVTGNMIYRPGNRGINAALVGQSVFSGNVIEDAGTDGFFLSGSDNRIADNQIIGAGRSAEGTYVGLAVSGSRNAIGGNVIRKFPRFEYGYAQSSASNTITLSANASGQNGFFTNAWVGIVQGTGAGQLRQISSYDGSTKVATVSTNWSTNPTTNSVYQIGLVELTVVSGTPTSATSDTATFGSWATGSSQRYTGGFIRVTAGTGAGQERLITSYTSGREATIDTAWTTQPDTNSTLVVSVPRGAWRGFVVVGESQVASDNSFGHGGMALDFLDAGTGTSISPKILLSEAAPTFGTYRVGDIAFNSDPDSGEPSYWVCSVSGDPGTWISGASTGAGSLPTSPSIGDLVYFNGTAWGGLGIGTNGTYLGVSGASPSWLPLNTDQVIIDGRSEALNELLLVDGGENIYLRPHRGGGFSTSLYFEALRGETALRITRDTQRLHSSGIEVVRVGPDGLRIQPAGISGNPAYALDVVGTSSLDGNVTVSTGSQVTLGGVARTNWPSAIDDISGLQVALDAKQPLDTDLSVIAAATGASNLVTSGDYAGHYHSADRNRTNHIGTQAISTVTGLQSALDGKQASASILTDLSSIIPSLGALLYYNGGNWVRFLPGTDGYVLKSSGGTIQWLAESGGGGSGTVTNVALAVPSGLTVSGSPITTGGTLTIGGVLGTSAGGTGITNTTAFGQDLLTSADDIDALTKLTLVGGTPTQIDSAAKVAVRKNSSGTGIGTRHMLNFIEGTNVSLTITDDAGNDEVDIIVNAAASAGSTNATYTTNYLTVPLFVADTTNTVSTSITTETNILTSIASWGSTNIALGTLASGSTLRLRAAGTFSATGDWSGNVVRFKVGGLTVAAAFDDADSLTPSAGSPWALDVDLLVASAGSSATVAASGSLRHYYSLTNTSVSSAMQPLMLSGTLDTTTNNAVALTFQNATGQEITLVRNTATLEWVGKQTILGGGSGTSIVTTSAAGLAPAASADSYLGTSSAGAVQWFARQIATNVFWGTPGTNTWTIPTNFLCGYVTCIGGGGGAASGGRTATGAVAYGGQGGSTGQVNGRWITAYDFGTNTTVTVIVGSGGAGGAARTTDSAFGSAGSNGGSSTFGTGAFAVSALGGFGAGQTTHNGYAPHPSLITGTRTDPGNIVAAQSLNLYIGQGTGHTGSGVSAANVALGVTPATSWNVVAGSGVWGLDPSGTLLGGGASTNAGGAGTNGVSTSFSGPYIGGGGGAGRSHTTADGGAGGNGGNYGAGGGGGGATRSGYNSGAGGNGGNGCVHIMYITR